jgi:hypothetical protein
VVVLVVLDVLELVLVQVVALVPVVEHMVAVLPEEGKLVVALVDVPAAAAADTAVGSWLVAQQQQEGENYPPFALQI